MEGGRANIAPGLIIEEVVDCAEVVTHGANGVTLKYSRYGLGLRNGIFVS